MRISFAAIALGASLLLLNACDKAPSTPSAPMVQPVQKAPSATASPATDTSVPSAGAVLAPADAAKVDPTPERSNTTMSAAQESTAMPMAGQNNDHSAPIAPAKRASAP